MKKEYSIPVFDLRFQVHLINSRKIGIFEECRCATKYAELFMILFRHRELKMISDGKKLLELLL